MDLVVYYNKIREQEKRIEEEFPIVVSNETGDGGKAGNLTEVPKAVAARMIVQGLARLAGAADAEEFRAVQHAAARHVEAMTAAARMQLSVMPTAQLDLLKSAAKLQE
jgi:hypothetical protein